MNVHGKHIAYLCRGKRNRFSRLSLGIRLQPKKIRGSDYWYLSPLGLLEIIVVDKVESEELKYYFFVLIDCGQKLLLR